MSFWNLLSQEAAEADSISRIKKTNLWTSGQYVGAKNDVLSSIPSVAGTVQGEWLQTVTLSVALPKYISEYKVGWTAGLAVRHFWRPCILCPVLSFSVRFYAPRSVNWIFCLDIHVCLSGCTQKTRSPFLAVFHTHCLFPPLAHYLINFKLAIVLFKVLHEINLLLFALAFLHFFSSFYT